MPDRVERRASELRKGDRLDLKGRLWTVKKAKAHGKRVMVTVESPPLAFTAEVKAKARYTVVVEASGSATASGRPTRERVGRGTASGPLLNASGAMTRWATPEDLEEPAEPRRTSPWKDIQGEDAVLDGGPGARRPHPRARARHPRRPA
jgi:hypothetical protein